MRRIIFFVFVTLIFCTGCAARRPFIKPELPLEKLSIANVSVSPKTIDLSKNQQAEIKYKLLGGAEVSVDIYDAEDGWVRSLKDNVPEKAGYNLTQWDGKDAKGNFVPSGAYIYVIIAKDKEARVAVYDPADYTAGIGLQHRDLKYNKETGRIRYVIPRAARVRIRIGIEEGPLLRTLVDWEPREAGENFEVWAGADEASNPISQKPKLVALLSAFSLPDNSIIVRNKELGFGQECSYEAGQVKSKRPKKNVAGIVLHPHARHLRQRCHEPGFKIEFPDVTLDKGGLPVLKGIVPIRIIVDKEDEDLLVESRFEIIAFVDDAFLFEEEQGFSPFNYLWNTKGIAQGEHILTINIQGYDDHIGTGSTKIKVEGRE